VARLAEKLYFLRCVREGCRKVHYFTNVTWVSHSAG
jgi:hypothetical protein